MKNLFPIFQNNPGLVYLDSAATTQTPQSVLDAMNNYYVQSRSNVHRGLYELAEQATAAYEKARDTVAAFLSAKREEIIFVPNATYGLNILAQMLESKMQPGDNIVLTRLEHHANLIPWQQVVLKNGGTLRYIEIRDYLIDERSIESVIDQTTAVVSFCLVSNVLGTIAPTEQIIKRAKTMGAISVVDATQAVAHMRIDVKALDCDALIFSGHKMYGPTGIGVMYVRHELLETLQPVIFGGGMVKNVTYETAKWNDIPYRFEPGTVPIAEVIGLGAAIEFLQNIGFDSIEHQEQTLMQYALEKFISIPGFRLIGLNNFPRGSVISFQIAGTHDSDIAFFCAKQNIAIRSGHHCAYPLMHHLGLSGVVRASCGVYTEKDDIDRCVEVLIRLKKIC